MRKKLLCAFFSASMILFYQPRCLAKSVRTVEVDDNGVFVVNTALGYSTILQFSSKPGTAVLGDQDAFKIEYVGNSITIKPLVPNAKSNLFIFTEYERYNCTLRTGATAEVDYIVKILPKRKADEPIKHQSTDNGQPRSRILNKSVTIDGFTLKIIAIGVSENRAVSADIEISSQSLRYVFSPQSLGVSQGGMFFDIERLSLSSLDVQPTAPVQGRLSLAPNAIKISDPFKIVFALPPKSPGKRVRRLAISVSFAAAQLEKKK